MRAPQPATSLSVNVTPSENSPGHDRDAGITDLYAHNLLCLQRDFGDELTDEQRAKLAAKLVKAHSFFMSRTSRISAASSMFDYAGKRAVFMESFGQDGLVEQDYLDVIMRAEQFIYLDVETISMRAQRVVDHFSADGLTRPAYVQNVFRKMPQVMSLTDRKIIRHLEAPMGKYAPKGLKRAQYLNMALKNPPLMATKAATVYQKMDFMLAMMDMKVFVPSEGQLSEADDNTDKVLFNYLDSAPTKLSYSIDNYLMRADWVMRGPKTYGGFGIMQMSRKELCDRYKENFGYDFSSRKVRENNPVLYTGLQERGLWRGVDSTRKGIGGPRRPQPDA